MPQANEVPQETRTSLWPHTSRRRTTQTVTATLIIGQAANSSHATGAGANGAGCGDCGCVCEIAVHSCTGMPSAAAGRLIDPLPSNSGTKSSALQAAVTAPAELRALARPA